jgi:hypothetical protein
MTHRHVQASNHVNRTTSIPQSRPGLSAQVTDKQFQEVISPPMLINVPHVKAKVQVFNLQDSKSSKFLSGTGNTPPRPFAVMRQQLPTRSQSTPPQSIAYDCDEAVQLMKSGKTFVLAFVVTSNDVGGRWSVFDTAEEEGEEVGPKSSCFSCLFGGKSKKKTRKKAGSKSSLSTKGGAKVSLFLFDRLEM